MAWNDVYEALMPLLSKGRIPVNPEEKLVSVAVSVHAVGSVVAVFQTLAERVVPTILKRIFIKCNDKKYKNRVF